MLRYIVLCFICLLIIGGCKGSSIDAAGYVENTVAGLELPPSYGIVTGVRYITIHNDTGYNTAGTITGGTLGGLFGYVMKGERQVVIGVAAAGVLAGQAMQRWLARSQFVELFIRPTDGRDFVIVQPTRGTPFYVGQNVKIVCWRGEWVIVPGSSPD